MSVSQRANLAGKKFGKLTALSWSHSTKAGGPHWLCRCDCGIEKVVGAKKFKGGTTQSCGCVRTAQLSPIFIHGESKQGARSTEYNIWLGVRRRCDTPGSKGWKYYGGRGISYCSRWNTFLNFVEDMGRRPSREYSLDRIDVNGNYEPGNCRWATRKQQAANRRKYGNLSVFSTKELQDELLRREAA